MNHEPAATVGGSEPVSEAETTPGETSENATQPERTLVMPMDVIIGRSAAAKGAVLMQKP